MVVKTCILVVVVLLGCTFLPLSSGLAASKPINVELSGRPDKKLAHPVVIMISSDSFRFGYQFKTHTPNIQRLIKYGTEAETGLIPVFPTATFPNHYSIATGLHPAYHGIINNYFFDPTLNDSFSTSRHEPEWWLGEPLWETVVNHGFNASTYFWPGSEAKKGKWTCEEYFCKSYNQSVPFEERVDTVLSYFDNENTEEIPAYLTLYLHYPDDQGHRVGPDDLEITEAVATVDAIIGRLIDGLEKRGIFEAVNIIFVGDHGMAGTCDNKVIFLDDLGSIPEDWVVFNKAVLGIGPPSGVDPSEVVAEMKKGLKDIENGNHLKVYLKQDLPPRLHYGEATDRIPPIIGLVDEGYNVTQTRPGAKDYCGGAHGYDNTYFSMRTIFIGHGPRFYKGKKVESFMNVEIYNLVTSILGIKGAPNNGTTGFSDEVLLGSNANLSS